MSVEQMKAELVRAYPGARWANRVKTMPEQQVFVIYTRLKKAGRI